MTKQEVNDVVDKLSEGMVRSIYYNQFKDNDNYLNTSLYAFMPLPKAIKEIMKSFLTERQASIINLSYGLSNGVAQDGATVARLLGISRATLARDKKDAMKILQSSEVKSYLIVFID